MLPFKCSQNRSSFLTEELNETNNICIISMCVYITQCWVLTKLICDEEPALLQLLTFLKQGTDGGKGTCFSQIQKKWSNTHFYSGFILDRGKDNRKTRRVALDKYRILKS